ncbi:type II toxin-antitoxin system HigB family toxin [Mesopusillimonas faecipullorum]|uniref:type II toxin-antitoxin system HigB family toxin n=1 Tax=Mesopusillimonas faecipullorum TaxID=2755040 RepID=UPI001D02D80B|nr:type II toxin-antitoxin system HigB family toxin [Mesopusillimonas faecipullorum]
MAKALTLCCSLAGHRRQQFGSVDRVGDLYVFDIGGNKYRLIAFLHAAHQLVYIKHVLTHSEYDKGDWKK